VPISNITTTLFLVKLAKKILLPAQRLFLLLNASAVDAVETMKTTVIPHLLTVVACDKRLDSLSLLLISVGIDPLYIHQLRAD
jgi:hypothetical protein